MRNFLIVLENIRVEMQFIDRHSKDMTGILVVDERETGVVIVVAFWRVSLCSIGLIYSTREELVGVVVKRYLLTIPL